jgi:hypothetical protein
MTAFLLVTGILLDPKFIVRIGMLRPHMLAILFFCLIIYSLFKKKPGLTFAFNLLFALSYHSFYLPLSVLFIYYASEFRLASPRLRILVWGSLGLVTGVILNPYFPWNLWMTIRHLSIALFDVGHVNLDFGGELMPWGADQFLIMNLPFLLTLVGAPFILLLTNEKFRAELRDSDFLWLWLTTLFYFALSAHTARAFEYSIPLGVIFFAFVARYFEHNPKYKAAFVSLLLLTAIPRLTFAYDRFSHFPAKSDQIDRLVATLRKLPAPAADKGAHIFNVNWDLAPYIYYSLPTLKFIDLLDPSFLYTLDPDLHAARASLRAGEFHDPWGMIRALTGSSYLAALQVNEGLNRQLKRDLHFTSIFLKIKDKPSGTVEIYEIKKERDPHFVLNWRGKLVLAGGDLNQAEELSVNPEKNEKSRWRELHPLHEYPEREKLGFKTEKVPSAYLDLKKTFEKETKTSPAKSAGPAGAVDCALLEPLESERAKQAGKTVVALGGGRNFRIWLNGQKVFRSIAARESINLMEQFVLLDRPLKESDQLRILVCSNNSAATMGVSLSFWTEQELSKTCADRGWTPPDSLSHQNDWPKIGEYNETCFGTYIRSKRANRNSI